jgi:hypothetical protein
LTNSVCAHRHALDELLDGGLEVLGVAHGCSIGSGEDDVGDGGARLVAVVRWVEGRWIVKERIAGIVIPDFQVPRHPMTPDRDYVTRSCAPVLTTRLCPSAGGLRTIGGR